jgi:sulfur dioxygenase
VIFRQLFESESSTYTYLLGCPETGEAVLIDPVLETIKRDLDVIKSLGLTLKYSLDTHVHADHITAACRLRELVGSKIAYPANENLPCADVGVTEDEIIALGSIKLQPLFTPGHTDTHYSYFLERGHLSRVFTGDALLIDGCGRTDFQNGDASTLYHSVRDKLFNLEPDTLVYPAHDYTLRRVSTIEQERDRNPRLGGDTSLKEFQIIMANLDLPYPKKIDIAVPANNKCGDCDENEFDKIQAFGGVSPQG